MSQYLVSAVMKNGHEVFLQQVQAESKTVLTNQLSHHLNSEVTESEGEHVSQTEGAYIVEKDDDVLYIVPKRNIEYLIVKREYDKGESNGLGGLMNRKPLP